MGIQLSENLVESSMGQTWEFTTTGSVLIRLLMMSFSDTVKNQIEKGKCCIY